MHIFCGLTKRQLGNEGAECTPPDFSLGNWENETRKKGKKFVNVKENEEKGRRTRKNVRGKCRFFFPLLGNH